MHRSLVTSLALLCTALGGSTARAQQYSCDFSSGTGRATAYGDAVIEGGALRLAAGIPNQSGSLILNTYAEGAKAFEATFDYTFNAANPPFNLAIGTSFTLGVLPDGVLPGAVENGTGSGLTVSFQLYDFDGNGYGGDCGIRIFRDGTQIAAVPGAINGYTDNHLARPVRVFLDYNGALTVTYNGNPVVTNLASGFVPRAGQRFGFAARTPPWDSGEHRIDNVVVRPYYRETNCAAPARISGDGIWGFSYGGDATLLQNFPCSSGGNARDIWFCWKAPTTGTVTLSTNGLTNDFGIVSVSDACGCSGFATLACMDPFPQRTGSITFHASAGATYSIRVAVNFFSAGGASGLEGFSISTLPDPVPCPADFNRNGVKNVQDIFDFLSAWFAPCP